MPSETKYTLENSLLIAEPSLSDGVFDRAVIHVSEYSEGEGAIGYILNKPTDRNVGEILTDPIFEPLKNIPVYFGGPVGTDHLVFSVFWWEEGSFRYRLRVSAQEATKIKRRPGSLLIAHVGHSSWYDGQLESELSEEVWISTAVSPSTLNWNATKLWGELMKEISPYHRLLARTPKDIGKN